MPLPRRRGSRFPAARCRRGYAVRRLAGMCVCSGRKMASKPRALASTARSTRGMDRSVAPCVARSPLPHGRPNGLVDGPPTLPLLVGRRRHGRQALTSTRIERKPRVAGARGRRARAPRRAGARPGSGGRTSRSRPPPRGGPWPHRCTSAPGRRAPASRRRCARCRARRGARSATGRGWPRRGSRRPVPLEHPHPADHRVRERDAWQRQLHRSSNRSSSSFAARARPGSCCRMRSWSGWRSSVKIPVRDVGWVLW